MSIEVAIFAGGCFWGMEELFRKLHGVVNTQVGYIGGDEKARTYIDVKTGNTGHAEAIKIDYRPSEISYGDLLKFFFSMHDPTTLNQQGEDHGSQYRSAIFYKTEYQKLMALQMIKRLEDSGIWGGPIVTEIVPASEWIDAEDHHQDYLQRNPAGYICHFVREMSL